MDANFIKDISNIVRYIKDPNNKLIWSCFDKNLREVYGSLSAIVEKTQRKGEKGIDDAMLTLNSLIS